MFLVLIPLIFSAHQVLVRRGLKRSDVLSGNFLSITTTFLIFLPYLLLRFYPDPRFLLSMVIAGILNFTLARICFYESIRRVGANVASALSALRIYVAEVVGALTGERVTPTLLLASNLIFFGIVAILNPEDPKGKRDRLGLMLGFFTAIFVVLSSYFVKIGLSIHDDPILGASVSFATAFLMATLLGEKSLRSRRFVEVPTFVLAGALVGLGHLLRYYALSLYPISVVEPVLSTYPLFTILLSRLSGIETIDKRTLVGCLFIVAGIVLCTSPPTS